MKYSKLCHCERGMSAATSSARISNRHGDEVASFLAMTNWRIRFTKFIKLRKSAL